MTPAPPDPDRAIERLGVGGVDETSDGGCGTGVSMDGVRVGSVWVALVIAFQQGIGG